MTNNYPKVQSSDRYESVSADGMITEDVVTTYGDEIEVHNSKETQFAAHDENKYIHAIEVVQDADVAGDLDLETRMFRLQQDDSNENRCAGRVLNYYETKDGTIELSIRLPDESLGRIEYDIPTKQSDWFTSVTDVAVSSDKAHTVGLANLGELKRSYIPIRKISGSSEYTWEIDVDRTDFFDELTDNTSSDSTEMRRQKRTRATKSHDVVGLATGFVFESFSVVAATISLLLAAPSLASFALLFDKETFADAVKKVIHRDDPAFILIGTVLWIIILGAQPLL